MARPEVVRRVVGEYGHRQTQQETQSRRHISNESSAVANNNNFGGSQYERSRYKSMFEFALIFQCTFIQICGFKINFLTI